MSVALEHRPVLTSRLVADERVGSRVKRHRRKSSAKSAVGRIVAGFGRFVALVLVSYAISAFAGQVLMEQARRESLRAKERAISARMDLSHLREDVQRLTSMNVVEEWAAIRGYVVNDQATVNPFESSRVALLR